ncbi:MAG: M48 family metallopeptidase [Bacteroidota bacterium]
MIKTEKTTLVEQGLVSTRQQEVIIFTIKHQQKMIKDNIELSPEFKAQTVKAIVSIAFFILVYLLLIAGAIALTFACVYAGILMIITMPRVIIIALGIGLASMGFLILIFLFKFMFKSHKVDRSHLVEISQKEEPELFQMIESIVEEVGTSFPKKVYLSSDVNAAVFYDSSFWSMFFPIKKNLQIGLGLVNSVTKEELKAILAHEFGHFSQKTMKVGSYVYNVNQVIYNMLYENESYDSMLQRWASVSGYFALFAVIAARIVQGIQWILAKMYNWVNLRYMALSREMEFHADEIAANVTGSRPLQTSLLRLNLAEHAFNSVLNYYGEKISENVKSANIYKEQSYVMGFLAKERQFEVVGGFPQVSLESLNRYNKSKLVIKDQWASHPSIEDRVKRLDALNLVLEQQDDRASGEVFKDIAATQEQLTQHLFSGVKYEGEVQLHAYQHFVKHYEAEYENASFDKRYNGYYDEKNPLPFDLSLPVNEASDWTFTHLFATQKVEEVYHQIGLKNDMEVIRQIAQKQAEIKSFDYNGQKYQQKESTALLKTLEKELLQIEQRIQDNDVQIYHYFLQQERQQSKAPQLETLYGEFFDFDAAFEEEVDQYGELQQALDFINYTTPFEQIKANFEAIEPMEARFKKTITQLLADEAFQAALQPDKKAALEKYLSRDWTYFRGESYFEDNLNVLFEAMNSFNYLLSRKYFVLKKRLLDYQLTLLVAK